MRRRPWIWIVGGTLVLVLGGVGLYLSQQVGDKDWWRREAEAYNRRHAIPDGENALGFYRTLPYDVHAYGLSEDWRMPIRQDDRMTLEAMRDLVGPTLQASRQTLEFRLDPSDLLATLGWALRLPGQIESATALLLLEARTHASEGRTEDALEHALGALRTGYLAQSGLYADQCIGLASREKAFLALQRLAMDAPPPPEALERAADEIGRLSMSRPSPEEAWELELLLDRGILETFYGPVRMSQITETRKASWVTWLNLAFTQPLGRSRRELRTAHTILAGGPPSLQRMGQLDALHSGATLFSRLMLPVKLMPKEREEDLVRERGTRLFLLLHAHRLRQGAYPESLQGFPGSEGFGYERQEGGQVLLRHGSLVFGAPPKNPVASPSPAP